MKTIQQLNIIINNLQYSIDSLLDRVQKCEQCINKIIGENRSKSQKNNGEKYQNYSKLSEGKMASDVMQLYRMIQKTSQKIKQQQGQQTMKKDFVIFSSNKDSKNKKMELQSFCILKNAILTNCNKIQALEQKVQNYKKQSLVKQNKSDQAISLLTSIITKIQQIIGNVPYHQITKQDFKNARKPKSLSITSRFLPHSN